MSCKDNMKWIEQYPQQIRAPHQVNNFIYYPAPFSAIKTFEMVIEAERS
jgi:hypothetical protein